MNLTNETFGYADAHDSKDWVGVRTGELVAPAVSGLLIHPDFVPAPKGSTKTDGDGGHGDNSEESGSGLTGGSGTSKGEAATDGTAATQFYAQFDLDTVRGIRQLGEILEHVSTRLGPNFELSLEIRATNDAGYDDATQRIVAANASNLGANGPEFE